MTQLRKRSLWHRLIAPRAQAVAPATILAFDAWPGALYAVGDVHGCLDLYQALEARIIADLATQGGRGVVVLLGDMIDRGPASADLIDHLLRPPPPQLLRIALRGNHEEMFTQFLADPASGGAWLRSGGSETLGSYGLDPGPFLRRETTARRRAMALAATVPPEHHAFLRGLADALIVPPFLLCHAGVDPGRLPEQQTAADLRWGRRVPASALDGADFPLKVVHGHVPSADGKALVTPWRINLDTGAYARGTLSAARLMRDGSVVVFEQSRG